MSNISDYIGESLLGSYFTRLQSVTFSASWKKNNTMNYDFFMKIHEKLLDVLYVPIEIGKN